eukprot:1162087-Pelagomonas_calceolata.AAC.19
MGLSQWLILSGTEACTCWLCGITTHVFFKSDLALAAELERRTQTERRLLEEAEAKRKAEEEAQRVCLRSCHLLVKASKCS